MKIHIFIKFDDTPHFFMPNQVTVYKSLLRWHVSDDPMVKFWIQTYKCEEVKFDRMNIGSLIE